MTVNTAVVAGYCQPGLAAALGARKLAPPTGVAEKMAKGDVTNLISKSGTRAHCMGQKDRLEMKACCTKTRRNQQLICSDLISSTSTKEKKMLR